MRGLVWFIGAAVGLMLTVYGILAGFNEPVILLGILMSFVSMLGGRRTFGHRSVPPKETSA